MRSDRERLEDILEHCELLRRHVSGRSHRLAEDPVLRTATLYWIQVVGEAAANVSSRLRDEHPQIPWREAIGARNALVHRYFGTDVDILHEVVEQHIPELEEQVRAILEELQ